MHRGMILSSVALLIAPLAATTAQLPRAGRTIDPAADAPQVTIAIDGVRTFAYAAPVRVRVRLSDDAYVVVGRVASDGRLTILFPASRTGRAFVRGHQDFWVRGRQSGSAATFYASDQYGEGYVFAIASYEPIDLTRFSNADFGFGSAAASRFQVANRRYAYRPEEMLERFASWVLYDPNSPFDYDIDYYSVDVPRYANASSLCYSGGRFMYDDFDVGTAGFGLNRYGSFCRGFYNSYLACLGLSIYNYYSWCTPYNTGTIVRGPIATPTTPTTPTPGPTDTANVKVIRGGQWQPDTVSRVPVDDKRRDGTNGSDAQGRAPRSTDTQQWDHIYSIPRRAIDDLKGSPADDGRRKDPLPTRNERGWVEPDARGVNAPPTRTTNEVPPNRAGPTRNVDVPARDGIGEQPRRLGRNADGGSSPPPRETPIRASAPPPRETPATFETPRRESSPPPREPMTRADPPPQRTATPAASPPPSKPPEEPRKPPEEPRKPPEERKPSR
jgi:uncharacterized protein DUF4384